MPRFGRHAGRLQRPFAYGDNEPGFLRQWNELCGRDQALNRVPPAQQGFGAHCLTAGDIDLDLIVKLESFCPDRFSQLIRQLETRLGCVVKGRREERHLVASILLGTVHRNIRQTQETFRVFGVLRINDDANACRELNLLL